MSKSTAEALGAAFGDPEVIAEQEAKTPKSVGFDHWCIVEFFGHSRIAGRVTEYTLGGSAFIRVDVPAKEGAAVEYTRLLGGAAIYAINITTEKEVRDVLGYNVPPITPRRRPRGLLGSHYAEDDGDMTFDDDDVPV